MVPLPFLPLLLIILKPQALAQPSSSGSLDPLEDQALAAHPSTRIHLRVQDPTTSPHRV